MAKKFIEDSENDQKLFAFLATFLSIVGFVIALVAKHYDRYVMFYVKQSLVVFIFGAVAGAIAKLLGFLPIIGWIIEFALIVLVVGAWILSWIYALSGEMKEVPVLGKLVRGIRV